MVVLCSTYLMVLGFLGGWGLLLFRFFVTLSITPSEKGITKPEGTALG